MDLTAALNDKRHRAKKYFSHSKNQSPLKVTNENKASEYTAEKKIEAGFKQNNIADVQANISEWNTARVNLYKNILAVEDNTAFNKTPAIRVQFKSLKIDDKKREIKYVAHLSKRGNTGKNARVFSWVYPYKVTCKKYWASHREKPDRELDTIRFADPNSASCGSLNASALWSGTIRLKINWKKKNNNYYIYMAEINRHLYFSKG